MRTRKEKRTVNHKPLKTRIAVFNQDFVFFIGTDPELVTSYCKRHFASDLSSQSWGLGKCLSFDSNFAKTIVIWTKRDLSNPYGISALTHECVHAANRTLAGIGARPDALNDEVQAYIVSFLIEAALGLNPK
ncbi:hypothetical protein [Bdellovibrio sp. BCCA]|uniref:hypothetical protein n=1 Tax=Bdellovibrio sp. BCCA TaxID=3136281 RepID=UPI0030F2B59B